MCVKPRSEKFQELRVLHVRFIGEQDGLPERLFKHRLVGLFGCEKTVDMAYLARVDLGGVHGVALCLRAASGSRGSIIASVGQIFSLIFSGQEHLDILFLSESQESQLRQVCRAFYNGEGGRSGPGGYPYENDVRRLPEKAVDEKLNADGHDG